MARGVPDRATQTEKRDPVQHSKGNPGEDPCCAFGNMADLALVGRREDPPFFLKGNPLITQSVPTPEFWYCRQSCDYLFTRRVA